MPNTIRPPLTHAHVRTAAVVAFLTVVTVVAVSIDAGDALAAMRWLGAMIVIGCFLAIFFACSMHFYFQHQRQQRKDEQRKQRRDARRARLSSVLEQAEQFKRHG